MAKLSAEQIFAIAANVYTECNKLLRSDRLIYIDEDPVKQTRVWALEVIDSSILRIERMKEAEAELAARNVAEAEDIPF